MFFRGEGLAGWRCGWRRSLAGLEGKHLPLRRRVFCPLSVAAQELERFRACRGAVVYILRHARRSWREEAKPTRSATRSMSRRV